MLSEQFYHLLLISHSLTVLIYFKVGLFSYFFGTPAVFLHTR